MKEIFLVQCPISNKPMALSKEPFGLIPNWLKREPSFNVWQQSLKLQGLKPKISILERVDVSDFDLQFEMYIGLFTSWNFGLFNNVIDPVTKGFDFQKIHKYSSSELGLIDGIGSNPLNLDGLYQKLYNKMNLRNRVLLLELMALYELRCLNHVSFDRELFSSYSTETIRNHPDIKVTNLLIDMRDAVHSKSLFQEVLDLCDIQLITYLNHLFWINGSPVILNSEIWVNLGILYGTFKKSSFHNTLEEDRLLTKYLASKNRSKALTHLSTSIQNTLDLFN